MKKKILSISMMMFLCNLAAKAQIEPIGGQVNSRRSIWDKEPEPQPVTTPYGGNLQQTTLGSVQQNGSMADPATPPPFNGNAQDGVPIDGGLGLLMGAGAAYAIRRLKGKKIKSQSL